MYMLRWMSARLCIFFYTDATTPVIYTLSLHDALPISIEEPLTAVSPAGTLLIPFDGIDLTPGIYQQTSNTTVLEADRKSTRLNSSHSQTSYAVFCLKKKTTYFFATAPPRAVRRPHLHP